MTEANSAEVRQLRLRVFGTVQLDGHAAADVLHTQPKRLALLAYLAVARPRGFHRRDRIVSLFWPEHGQEHARAALRKAIYAIRSVVGEDAISSRGDEEVAINRDVISCDVTEFDRAMEEDDLSEALRLYEGPLLDGFFADAPGFERWAEQERERYRELATSAALSLAERYRSNGKLTDAAQWARRVALLATTDERALRRVLLLLETAGDRAGAVRAYEEFARRLREEYGIEPSAETVSLIKRIRG